MFRSITACVLSCALVFTIPVVSSAQSRNQNKDQLGGSGARKHVQTIVFAGLAGAILGLSTLSFYGRPQDRLANVPVGAAIGIIVGAIYTTYQAAAEPKEFYSLRDPANPELWRLSANARDLNAQAPRTSWSFSF